MRIVFSRWRACLHGQFQTGIGLWLQVTLTCLVGRRSRGQRNRKRSHGATELAQLELPLDVENVNNKATIGNLVRGGTEVQIQLIKCLHNIVIPPHHLHNHRLHNRGLHHLCLHSKAQQLVQRGRRVHNQGHLIQRGHITRVASKFMVWCRQASSSVTVNFSSGNETSTNKGTQHQGILGQ